MSSASLAVAAAPDAATKEATAAATAAAQAATTKAAATPLSAIGRRLCGCATPEWERQTVRVYVGDLTFTVVKVYPTMASD